MSLIEPYGGKLVDRKFHDMKADRKNFYNLKVNRNIVMNTDLIATGAFSPLEGFMTKKDFDSVVNKMTLSNGLAWTIPIVVSVSKEQADDIKKQKEILLVNEENEEPFALLEVEDVYTYDKMDSAQKIYLTTERKHPGVNNWLNQGDYFVGGKIKQLKRYISEFSEYVLTPEQTRAHFKKMGWNTVCGFQTRNIPHRGHEHHQRTALEITDGLFIHPLIGWKKVGDFKPAAIFKAYNALIDNYYPKNKILIGALITPMNYAGPREAVFHAIIRRNFGCSHFIVGGDHAGVGSYYGVHDAHKIFEKLPEIGIQILKFKRAYYCHKTGNTVTDSSTGTDTKHHEEISGTKIRAMLRDRKEFDVHYLRKEVLEVLSEDDLITPEDI